MKLVLSFSFIRIEDDADDLFSDGNCASLATDKRQLCQHTFNRTRELRVPAIGSRCPQHSGPASAHHEQETFGLVWSQLHKMPRNMTWTHKTINATNHAHLPIAFLGCIGCKPRCYFAFGSACAETLSACWISKNPSWAVSDHEVAPADRAEPTYVILNDYHCEHRVFIVTSTKVLRDITTNFDEILEFDTCSNTHLWIQRRSLFYCSSCVCGAPIARRLSSTLSWPWRLLWRTDQLCS